jgi:hypothetical protein
MLDAVTYAFAGGAIDSVPNGRREKPGDDSGRERKRRTLRPTLRRSARGTFIAAAAR